MEDEKWKMEEEERREFENKDSKFKMENGEISRR